MVRRAAVHVSAAMPGGGGVLRRGRFDRKPLEEVCRRQGQRYAVSWTRWCHGPHRQRDRRCACPAVWFNRTGSSGMIGVAVLGSTGSIGESTLDVLARHPDRFKLVGLGANRNVAKLAAQVLRWRPAYAVLADENAARELVQALGGQVPETRVLAGADGLVEIATLRETDCV